MKIYSVVMRNSTVVDTCSVRACNAKRARKYLKKKYSSDWYAPGWSIYKMQRVF